MHLTDPSPLRASRFVVLIGSLLCLAALLLGCGESVEAPEARSMPVVLTPDKPLPEDEHVHEHGENDGHDHGHDHAEGDGHDHGHTATPAPSAEPELPRAGTIPYSADGKPGKIEPHADTSVPAVGAVSDLVVSPAPAAPEAVTASPAPDEIPLASASAAAPVAPAPEAPAASSAAPASPGAPGP